jgi:type 1 glutamine amidotransferase
MGFLRTPVYETVRPQLPALHHPAVFVFSKTNAFIHREAIPAAKTLLQQLADNNGWSIYFSDSSALYNRDDLAKFDAIVWNNVTGDVLSPDQRAAMRRYIENGGGFVGLHGAGDASVGKSWPWYTKVVIGARFIGHPFHPQFQQATVIVEDRNDPMTRHLPQNWRRTDEWYSFAASPRQPQFHILASLDESSYSPMALGKSMRMGADHPIIWRHCVNDGRVFYSAMGHTAESYQEPAYRTLIEQAVAWAAGTAGALCHQGVEQ